MPSTAIRPFLLPRPRKARTRLGRSLRAVVCLTGLLLLWLPSLAHACAVCFQSSNDASRIAFIATTAFMTLLPLVVLFLAIRWFVGRARAAEEADRAALLSRSRAPS